MAKKKVVKKDELAMVGWGCCISPCGLIHFLGGLGVGFLLVQYLNWGGLMFWGWLLVIVAIAGHFWKKTRCDYCSGM